MVCPDLVQLGDELMERVVENDTLWVRVGEVVAVGVEDAVRSGVVDRVLLCDRLKEREREGVDVWTAVDVPVPVYDTENVGDGVRVEEGEGLPVGENDKEVVPVLETVPLTLSVAVGLKLKEGLGDLERVGVGEGGEGVGVREKV
eukprot:EG_transcript_25880